MKRQCQIITDSPCDLPFEFLQEHEVDCLYYSYSEPVDEKNSQKIPFAGTDDLFQSITPHDFYNAIRKGACPMTSQPSQGALEAMFEKKIQDGLPCVYLCFSGALSGCYEGALMALERIKEKYGEDVEFYVVNLKLGSTPQSLIVYEAIRQRDSGCTAQELIAWVREARYFVHTMFMVDDLQALKRGGRIPSAVALAGSLLDAKPLLTIDLDGKLTLMGVCRGRKKGLKKLAEFYQKNICSNEYSHVVALGNADCLKDRDKVKELIQKTDDTCVFLETTIGPTVGCHVGAGMLAVSCWGEDRRKTMGVSDQIAHEVKSKNHK